MIFLAAICLALVAVLLCEKRQNSQREREWSLERGALLQRIQAPEVAIADYVAPVGDEEEQYAHFEDDDHFAD